MVRVFSSLVDKIKTMQLRQDIRVEMRYERLGAMGINARETMRQFVDNPDGWSGVPVPVQTSLLQNIGDVVKRGVNRLYTPSLEQYRELDKAMEMVRQSPTGRALLESSEQGHVLTRLDTQTVGAGYYDNSTRIVGINPAALNIGDGVAGFRACLANVLVHEHFHAFQHRRRFERPSNTPLKGVYGNGIIDSSAYNQRDSATMTMHVEAAAHALQVQVAYELKETYPSMWKDIKANEEMSAIVSAFEKTVADNPKSLAGGQAMRAAHDAWFAPENISLFSFYERRILANQSRALDAVEKMLDIVPKANHARFAEIWGSLRFGAEDYAEAATLPDGRNHLKLAGYPAANDRRYQTAFSKRFENGLSANEGRIGLMKAVHGKAGPGRGVQAFAGSPTSQSDDTSPTVPSGPHGVSGAGSSVSAPKVSVGLKL